MENRIIKRLNKQAAKEPTRNDIYEFQNDLEDLKSQLDEVLSSAEQIKRKSRQFGGEFDRVLGGQLEGYFIGTLKAFSNSSSQPGSIASLADWLDDYLSESEQRGTEDE